ncbi:Oxidoreductase molybdopterin binding domain-containing protein [Paenibacillus sp. UNCCL117]|uniref:sulfite oxidase-like oxidoreductase n=1 Tax=unclassified Paenibacillus TaxID=185978 RepID=UPI00088EFB1C|nr:MULTISPECIES: sulfite oxidase-like oxidoreductase [unclassified Paenibacillus]SDC63253.1 Oxidoreductase molybdopterin binding domain-containing protein [Paenibacillus sp. cl123]SFW22245.1 Oxidoreductase molybdopterin binding domain-containing protein [Paenibacillus sp. UNCCL117]
MTDGSGKDTKASRIKRMKVPVVEQSLAHRVPPGQVVTERFPILHEGEVPTYRMEEWSLRIFGAVEEQRIVRFEELLALPQTRVVCDIHCVTRWSKLDTAWEGVLFRDFLRLLNIVPTGPYVMLHADHDYETNVRLDELLGDDILLAFKYDGKPLTPKHGWPLRLVVPHLYFWKSPKWLRGIEFMTEDREGFWERNGFHNEADPFKEERFSGEPLPIPEDEWHSKDFD